MRFFCCCATALLAACTGGAPADEGGRTVDSAAGVDAVVPRDAGAVAQPAESSAAPRDSSDELRVLASRLIIPVQGVVASQLRDSYTDARSGHTHEALDIMAPRGTPVLSAADGRLLKLFQSVRGGTMVYAADPSDRFILMYGHLDAYADGLVAGMPLRQGQLLGYVGSTGDADAGAPHLHFAIARGHPSVAWWKGEPVNPYPLLVRR